MGVGPCAGSLTANGVSEHGGRVAPRVPIQATKAPASIFGGRYNLNSDSQGSDSQGHRKNRGNVEKIE
jgi:hypothetical protein